MSRIALHLSLIAAVLTPPAIAQTIPLTASHISVGGTPLASGTFCVQPVDNTNTPIIATLGGVGGALVTEPSCTTVTNGALASGFQVPDTAISIPRNVCLRVTITDLNNPRRGNIYPAPCMQPASSGQSWCAGGTCNFDNYTPNTSALPVVQTGPQGPAGNTGNVGPAGPAGTAATIAVGTTTTGAAGTNAIVTNSGTPAAAVINFTIPQGLPGVAGPQGPQGPGSGNVNGPASSVLNDIASYSNTSGTALQDSGVLASGGVLGWGTSGTVDTGLSRSAAKTLYLGNGTAGDYSGTLRAATVQACNAGGCASFSSNGSNGFVVNSGQINFQGNDITINGKWEIQPTTGTSTTLAIGTGTTLNSLGSLQYSVRVHGGTTFTATGCSVSALTGGAAGGTFTLGANSCSVVVTIAGATGYTAPNGYTCTAHDRTTPAAAITGEASSTTTTATITIPSSAAVSDVISFHCDAF